jgi:predicted Zn-dependent peptidase
MLDRLVQPGSERVVFDVAALPEYSVLSNGVGMYAINISSTELVRVDFMFKGGQWLQTKALQAGLTYKMLKDGTKLYPHDVIAERLDFYGASVEAGVNLSYGRIGVTCLKKHLQNVLPIVLDMIEHPVFSEDRLSIALQQAKVSYDVSMQTVGEQCKRLFYKSLFEKDHPMSQFPKSSDYSNLFVHDLDDYVSLNNCTDNCVVFLTCDLDSAILHYVQSSIEKWSCGVRSAYRGFGELNDLALVERRFEHKMDTPVVQACLRMGCRTLQRNHSDYVSLMVLTTILGGYFGSRLMSNIRESKGYTYDISASLFQTPQCVLLSVKTETSSQYVDDVVREVYKEMDRLRCELVSKDELGLVKNYLLGYMCRGYENNFLLSSRLMNLCSNGLTLKDIVSESEKIRQVTPIVLRDVAERYFQPNTMVECIAK